MHCPRVLCLLLRLGRMVELDRLELMVKFANQFLDASSGTEP